MTLVSKILVPASRAGMLSGKSKPPIPGTSQFPSAAVADRRTSIVDKNIELAKHLCDGQVGMLDTSIVCDIKLHWIDVDWCSDVCGGGLAFAGISTSHKHSMIRELRYRFHDFESDPSIAAAFVVSNHVTGPNI